MSSLSSNDLNFKSPILIDVDSTISHSHASWRDGLLSDWTVVVRERYFPVHRYVLGLGPRSSTYFYNQFHFNHASIIDRSVLQLGRALLCTCTSDNCCCADVTVKQMEDIDESVETYFSDILEYMYEGSIHFTEDNIACIYAIADFLQINSLICCMDDEIFDLVNKTNVIKILLASDKFRLHSGSIIRNCVELLARSFSTFDFEDWCKIPPAWLHQIFNSGEFNASTDTIVRCVLRLLRISASQFSSTDILILLLCICDHHFDVPGADALFLLGLAESFSQSHFDQGIHISHMLSLTALQNRCYNILAWSFHELPIDSLASLSVSSILQLLDSDDLHVLNEDQVYEHIRYYLEANPVISDDDALLIWKTCRFTLLSAETLWNAQSSSAPKNLVLVGAILAGAMQKNEPFVNAIPKDISGKLVQRRIVRPLVAMFAEIADSTMAILQSDRTVKHLMSNQFVTYPARGSVKCNSTLHSVSWRFQIHAANIQGMAIGLMSVPTGNPRPNASRLGGATGRSWAILCHTGKKLHNGKSEDYGLLCADGDIIDMELSHDAVDRGTLTFFKNGKRYGGAFTGIQGQVSPAVTLYRRNQQVSMSLCRPTTVATAV